MTKREIVDRIREIDAAVRAIDEEIEVVHQRRVMLDEERAMLLELLDEWPDGAQTLAALRGDSPDSEPPITEPGTPRTKSSQRMAAVTMPPPTENPDESDDPKS
jgi:hypothetical protein